MLSLFCIAAPFVLTATAGQTEREAALFIRNALDESTPFSYWSGGESAAPTIFFYMEHRAWNDGNAVMRHEGKKLLSCVADLLSTSLGKRAKPVSTEAALPRRYRILVNPLPPGGGTQLAAEGLAQRTACPKGREQEVILRLLMSKANPHSF
ncbi:hypothetical protein C2W62_33880 [Candidatus Entotheonella serta]|nr:hypothetical protein C2W62_33880 [Candidatus Entotheonella serta]